MSLELPAVHAFPPFFTRQPNQETFKSQLQQWSAIILVYYKFYRKYRMSLTPETLSSDLFTNKSINRSLKLETLREIVEHMVLEGHAEYTSKKKDEALIYWRRPDEWSQLLSRHIENTGQNNSVLTIYELTEADEAKDSEFWQMDKSMLRKVVDVLAKKGKAAIMKGPDGEEQGIKFL